MRDKYGVGGDPACYPGTDVLQNRLGLHDPELLAAAEAELAAIAVEHIEINGPPFDFPYLCGLHRQLFGEVYEWAGEIRGVDISKGGTRFCAVSRIVPEATRLLDELADVQYFLGLDRPFVAHQVAHLDGQRLNNHVSNLAWLLPIENDAHKDLHGTRLRGSQIHCAKLTEAQVVLIRQALAVGIRQCVLAQTYGVSDSTVSLIARAKTWRHVQ